MVYSVTAVPQPSRPLPLSSRHPFLLDTFHSTASRGYLRIITFVSTWRTYCSRVRPVKPLKLCGFGFGGSDVVVGCTRKPLQSINRRPSTLGHFVLEMMAAAHCDWCADEMEAGRKAQWL
jgi:hypothetical protein